MLAAAGLPDDGTWRPLLVRLYPDRPGHDDVAPARASRFRRRRDRPRARATAPSRTGSRPSLPRNLVESAVRGEILPLLLFAVFLGLAIARLPDDRRARRSSGRSRPWPPRCSLCVRWILALHAGRGLRPHLSLRARRRRSGGRSPRGVGRPASRVLLLLATALLYPAASALLGRTSLRAFARAVAPAQLVAVATRSSIAALPALVEGGRERLKLPDAATGLRPAAVGVGVQDQAGRSRAPAKAHLSRPRLRRPASTRGRSRPSSITVMILSFSTVGLPSGGANFRASRPTSPRASRSRAS